ncbi:MAG: toxin-antitoxin system YwqK family antitoxin [Endomicrobium sp.]|jgi:antitoxin component YwqK of YwqJK toxin-antitoxin module|nr:toxin-antitoxin system YwqK family antitoxin [Endomicrobium sp.]
MKKTAFILAALFLIFADVRAYINKTKVVTGHKEAFFIYTDEKGTEIAKERILQNGKTELILGTAINGEVRELDEKGSLIYLWRYKDNRLEGLSYKFYPSGAVLYELTYEKDILRGAAKKYYEDGSVAEEVIYEDGKVEGIAKVYLKNGNCYEYSYKDGKLNGKTRLYDSSRRLLETLEYKDNILDGTVSKYYLSGALKSDVKYSNGKENKDSMRIYDEKGRQIMEGSEAAKIYGETPDLKKSYVNEKILSPSMARRSGSKILSWQGPAQNHLVESRKMVAEFSFFLKKDGKKKLNGKHRVNYKNGNIRFEGYFVSNRPHGTFKTYLPDGTVVALDHYVNGKLYGVSKTYYSTGLKLAEYEYWNGEINGTSKVYNKNGDIVTEVHYKKNLMHGAFKIFYDDGALCFESYFSNGEPVDQLRYYWPDGKRLRYLVEFSGGGICKSSSFSDNGFEEYSASY